MNASEISELEKYVAEKNCDIISFDSIYRNYNLLALSLGDAKSIADKAVQGHSETTIIDRD